MAPSTNPKNLLHRPFRSQITDKTVDPIADELHPAVTAGGLPDDFVREFVRLQFDRQIADITLGPGQMPAGPNDARRVVAVVQPPGVHRGPGIADEQRADIPLDVRLLELRI